MKFSLFQPLVIAVVSVLGCSSSKAQEITEDSFTMEAGYSNMVYYSLESGVVAQSPLADWHVALDVRPMVVRHV